MQAFLNGFRAAKWLGCGALVLSAAACSKQPVAREPGDVSRNEPQNTRHETADARDDVASTIRLSEELRRECQLPSAPQEAPQFATNQTALPAEGRSILNDVATCLTDGALRGRSVLLIGRSDPRGATEQNQQIAETRADTARDYLVKRGVARDRLHTAARGEHGAQGTDEASWALDRRVDIELVTTTASREAAATPSPVLEGTRLQAVSPGNTLATEAPNEPIPRVENPRLDKSRSKAK